MATATVLDRLGPNERAAVRALAEQIEGADGAPPLNDEALSRLEDSAPEVTHLVIRGGGGDITGYGQLDGAQLTVTGERDTLDPLLAAAEQRSSGDELQLWAHGTRSRVAEVAEARGYAPMRTLWQLRRPLRDLPDADLPAGVRIRPFRPGQDEDAWLAVNAAAFAAHPEQGRWTRRDLAAREAAPWFDPAGFLLADHDGSVLGYHWTKMHPDGLGEVYVLGVAPAAQGAHLGPALLAAGLHYLCERGAPEVLLYVEGDNARALALYERFGFRRHDRDVQYRRILARGQRI